MLICPGIGRKNPITHRFCETVVFSDVRTRRGAGDGEWATVPVSIAMRAGLWPGR